VTYQQQPSSKISHRGRAFHRGPERARERLAFALAVVVAGAGCAATGPRGDAGAADPPRAAARAQPPGPEVRARGSRDFDEARPALRLESTFVGAGHLWQRLRRGFALLDAPGVVDHAEGMARIEAERRWFERNQAYLDRTAERARLYLFDVVEEAERRRLPLELALLPVVESAFQPLAVSRSHAVGLWQFVPATGRLYGLAQTWWYDGRRDVWAATRAAFDYLEKLNGVFEGDWLLALAAYNWGEGNVQRAVRRNRRAGEPTDFWSLRTPRETRAYVPRLLAIAAIVAEPARYGLRLMPIANEPYFERVRVGRQIELALAARLAGVDFDELYALNPGHKRWATPPDGPHDLLVPVAHAERLRRELASLPAGHLVRWRRHRIRRGETLGGIAMRYRTTVSVLRELNSLRGTLIRAGADLVVPAPGAGPAPDATARLARADSSGGPEDGTAVHRVRRGDTLWDIARRYRVSTDALAAWNGIGRDDLLHPGQQLKVRRSRAGATAVPAVASARVRRHIRYTVRPGDSLWFIGRRFGVSVDALRDWNRIAHGAYLRPGQIIEIHPDPAPGAGRS